MDAKHHPRLSLATSGSLSPWDCLNRSGSNLDVKQSVISSKEDRKWQMMCSATPVAGKVNQCAFSDKQSCRGIHA
eukprot:4619764-Amphidinium_carterae.1